jgi:hypothetical protein
MRYRTSGGTEPLQRAQNGVLASCVDRRNRGDFGRRGWRVSDSRGGGASERKSPKTLCVNPQMRDNIY